MAGFAILVVIVAATLLWVTVAGSVQASSRGGPALSSPYQGMTQVVVQPGQTLWSIAAAAEPSASTWAVVQQITEVNALNGAWSAPGNCCGFRRAERAGQAAAPTAPRERR